MGVSDYTRRDFLKSITTATLAAMGLGTTLPVMASAAQGNQGSSYPILHRNDVVLFQGDSITDAGRNREDTHPNSQGGLGPGYAFLAAADLLAVEPGKSLKVFNRGISGNKVFQLAARWQEDCLALQPNILSILVGVNDFWHTLTHGYNGTVETYEKDFRALLDSTLETLPDVTLIIGEPYAMPEGRAVNDQWFPTFYKYQQAARRIARDYKTAFIPYQSIYDEASKRAPQTYWTADGVHPTTAGCHLMAQAWLSTLHSIRS